MGQYELKGILYPNDYKTKPSQPDYTGKATVEGVDYKIAAWDNGAFINIQFTTQEDVDKAKAKAKAKCTTVHKVQYTQEEAPPWDDDVPF